MPPKGKGKAKKQPDSGKNDEKDHGVTHSTKNKGKARATEGDDEVGVTKPNPGNHQFLLENLEGYVERRPQDVMNEITASLKETSLRTPQPPQEPSQYVIQTVKRPDHGYWPWRINFAKLRGQSPAIYSECREIHDGFLKDHIQALVIAEYRPQPQYYVKCLEKLYEMESVLKKRNVELLESNEPPYTAEVQGAISDSTYGMIIHANVIGKLFERMYWEHQLLKLTPEDLASVDQKSTNLRAFLRGRQGTRVLERKDKKSEDPQIYGMLLPYASEEEADMQIELQVARIGGPPTSGRRLRAAHLSRPLRPITQEDIDEEMIETQRWMPADALEAPEADAPSTNPDPAPSGVTAQPATQKASNQAKTGDKRHLPSASQPSSDSAPNAAAVAKKRARDKKLKPEDK